MLTPFCFQYHTLQKVLTCPTPSTVTAEAVSGTGWGHGSPVSPHCPWHVAWWLQHPSWHRAAAQLPTCPDILLLLFLRGA